MLISFEVENFLSIKDRQELSMIANPDKEMESSHCIEPGSAMELKLLKSAAVYGANASGKSNLVKALLYMRNTILTSAATDKIKEGTRFQPFILDRYSIQKPGFFEIQFLIDRKIYIYGFKIDDTRILNEWLYFYPHKTRALLFSRDLTETGDLELSGNHQSQNRYKYKFGNYFKGEKNKIVSLTRSNALYLTVGAQFAHPVLEKVFEWFSHFLRTGITPETKKNGDLTTKLMEGNGAVKKKIVAFLKSADLGIEDIKIEKLEKEVDTDETVGIKMIHRAVSNGAGNETVAHIDFDDESLGTQRMYQLCGPLIDVLFNGGVLIIDELEDSLHLHMLRALLSEFFEHSDRSQIIFTTHNVQLLEEKLFRRDEIWFTEKGADGGTELFSLADFKPKPRKDKSLKNGYLNGAFGALPVLGDLLSG